MTGMATSLRIVKEIIPPFVRAATRCMSSEPAPALQKMGATFHEGGHATSPTEASGADSITITASVSRSKSRYSNTK